MTKIQELELIQAEIRFCELKIVQLKEKEKELNQDYDLSGHPYLPVSK